MTPPSRIRRAARILAIQVVVWPLALLLAEGANRARLGLQDRPYQPELVRAYFEKLRENAGGFLPGAAEEAAPAEGEEEPELDRRERVAQPWTGYDMVGGLLTIDKLLRDMRKGRGASHYKVLIVGGSVAQMFGNPERLKGASDVLAKTIAADPRLDGRQVSIWNFGRGGFKQPQQMHMFLWLVTLGLAPDAVVNLDGFNEVALGNTNWDGSRTHPAYPSVGHWGHIVQGAPDEESLSIISDVLTTRDRMIRRCELGLRWQVWRSSIVGAWLFGDLERDKLFCVEGQKHYEARIAERARLVTRGPAMPKEGAEPVLEAVRVWKETSRTMRQVCEARGIYYVHVLQPTMHDPGSRKALTPDEERVGVIGEHWLKGVQRGYPLLRRAGRELRAEGEVFLDATDVFDGVAETLYTDNCHVDRAGNVILAQRVAAYFLENLPVGDN